MFPDIEIFGINSSNMELLPLGHVLNGVGTVGQLRRTSLVLNEAGVPAGLL